MIDMGGHLKDQAHGAEDVMTSETVRTVMKEIVIGAHLVGIEVIREMTHVVRHENDLMAETGQDIRVFVVDVKDITLKNVEHLHEL